MGRDVVGDDVIDSIDWVETGDGSPTRRHPSHGETYHSTSGAFQEAIERFVGPCNIRQLARKGTIRILDVGLGLGFNAAFALQGVRKEQVACRVELIALESDLEILSHLKGLSGDTPGLPEEHAWIRRAVEEGHWEGDGFRIEVILGPAEETIGRLTGTFDAVFHDPFSPPNNSELWTVSFFSDMARIMAPGAILSTFSSAIGARAAMVSAGFLVGMGPSVGAKRSGTLASLSGELPPLPEKLARKIARRAVGLREAFDGK